MSQVSPPWSPRTPSTLVLQGKGKVKMSVSPPVSRSTRNSINDDVSDSFSTVPAFHTSPPGTPTGNPSMSYDGSFDSSFDASSGSLQRWSFSDSSKEEPKELSLAGLLAISIGFGTDAYNIFLMNILLVVLKHEYKHWTHYHMSFISSSVIFGAVLGQIIFGTLADKYGRTKMFLVTLGIIGVFSAMSAAAPVLGNHSIGLYVWLVVSRFGLGLGIGGEYPLSATITTQNSSPATLGRNMGWVICSQGFGNLFASTFCALLIFSNVELEWVWRASFLLPVFACLLTAWPRFNLADSTKQEQIPQDVDVLSWLLVKEKTRGFFDIIWKHKKTLLGTAGSWFLFDISFYGNSLFNGSVMKILHFKGNSLEQTALFCLVVSAIGLPGLRAFCASSSQLYESYQFLFAYISLCYSLALCCLYCSTASPLLCIQCVKLRYFAATLFADRLGRKNIQILGFFMMAVIFTTMGTAFDTLSKDFPIVFVVLYGLTFFFSNFGPNVTTFIISAEVFPHDVAATCFGISAACGKLGALLGSSVFDIVKTELGIPAVFGICAGLSVAGLFLTILVTQDKRDIEIVSFESGDKGSTESSPTLVVNTGVEHSHT